jgi:hypothetical protein
MPDWRSPTGNANAFSIILMKTSIHHYSYKHCVQSNLSIFLLFNVMYSVWLFLIANILSNILPYILVYKYPYTVDYTVICIAIIGKNYTMPYALDVGVYGVVNFKMFEGRDQTIRQEMENHRQPADGLCGICVQSCSHPPCLDLYCMCSKFSDFNNLKIPSKCSIKTFFNMYAKAKPG